MKATLGYEILIQSDSLNHLSQYLHPYIEHRKVHIITDTNVAPLYQESFTNQLCEYRLSWSLIEAGEAHKTMDTVLSVIEDLVENNLQRSDVIIALGGGVVGDLAGFVAAIYLRGIDFIQIPTTLLAQVDSSVGSKVGVDFAGGKNLVGHFYSPKFVLIDPNSLKTLDDRQFKSGMAEVIKYGCIHSEALFNTLWNYSSRNEIQPHLETIIRTCCDIKTEFVLKDFYDRKERLYLNFGHTIGHALESLTHYQVYTHGEAISIGMNVMMQLTSLFTDSDSNSAKRLRDLCEAFALPVDASEDLERCLPFLAKDKKNLNHQLNIVYCPKIGQCEILKLSLEDFKEYVHAYHSAS